MVRKRIGIVTLYGHANYGNKLQNYALQETLKKLGYDVETLKLVTDSTSTTIRRKITKIFNLKKLITYLLKKTTSFIYKKPNIQRYKNFICFSNEYINETDSILSNCNSNEFVAMYDYFVVGSDQVWNPYYITGKTPFFFLSFAPKNKRIAYAASFGISELPDEYHNEYKNYLRDFMYISVREEEGAEIVYNLINQEVPVVLDPTLLLSKREWLIITNPKKIINEKYLLTYFLGKISKEVSKKIKQYAKKHNLKIINIMDKDNKGIYTSGPSEFLSLINNSTLFCTNSFHGTVFAILFEKPFIVFERKTSFGSMFSRIDTLLSTVKLESRIINNIKPGEELICDFSHVEDILNKEREKSINYLKKALDIEE